MIRKHYIKVGRMLEQLKKEIKEDNNYRTWQAQQQEIEVYDSAEKRTGS